MSLSALLFTVVAAFGSGSIPTGLLVARFQGGVDLRSMGSGNIGATNVYRAFGIKWALLVFLADALKGFVPVFLAGLFGLPGAAIAAAGVIAVCGHVFNPFLRGKGGKGVATAFGVMLVISPLSALSALLLWGVLLARTRIVSLASLAAAAMMPAATLIFAWNHLYRLEYLTASILLAGLVAYSHRENINRLRRGEEKKVSRNSS